MMMIKMTWNVFEGQEWMSRKPNKNKQWTLENKLNILKSSNFNSLQQFKEQ